MSTSMTILIFLTLSYFGSALAQEPAVLKLPPVSLKQDKPLMQALKERKSSREFRNDTLRLQDLANLLWCANGVNRPDTKHRTVPTAMNKQDIDVYVVNHNGIYRYDAFAQTLILVREGDHRSATGSQEFVGKAPVNLVYVSDFAKLDFSSDESSKLWMAGVEAGHCSQNVYLYAAVADLAVVVRASIDRTKIGELLNLGAQQRVILAQTVGYAPGN